MNEYAKENLVWFLFWFEESKGKWFTTLNI